MFAYVVSSNIPLPIYKTKISPWQTLKTLLETLGPFTLPRALYPRAARGGKWLLCEAQGRAELVLPCGSSHHPPGGTFLLPSGELGFSVFCHLQLLMPFHQPWKSWVSSSHPLPTHLGLNKGGQSEKPLGKALFWSRSSALPGLGDTPVDQKTLLVPKSQFSPSSFHDNTSSGPRGRFYYFIPKVWFPPCISVLEMCHLWLKVELSFPEQLKFGLIPPWSTLQLAEHC